MFELLIYTRKLNKMDNSSKIPTLLEYIEENKSKIQETPIKNIPFIQKISWTFYFFSFFLAFTIVPKIIYSIFAYWSLFFNVFLFVFFVYLTFEYRRSISPKKQKTKKSISQDFNNIISLISNYGFSNTSNDITSILKYSTSLAQLNKEYINIIDEALTKYIKIIVKISNLSYKTISDKSNERIPNQNLNSQEIDGNFLNHFNNFSKKNLKNYKHKINLGDFQHKPFEFSIPGIIHIYLAKKTSIVDLAGIIKIGQGHQFEGIEILKGLILIGRNEYFDGIIVGSFKLGKDLSVRKEKYPVQNQELVESSYQQINENNYCAHATSSFLSHNPELKFAAEDACRQIAEIRAHCEEIIADDIKNDLSQTAFNLKEKLDREKRIMNEMGKI
jgi:hypothetical protein